MSINPTNSSYLKLNSIKLMDFINKIDEDGTRLERPSLIALLQKIKENAIEQANSMDIRLRVKEYSV
jgi:hypothetical protein